MTALAASGWDRSSGRRPPSAALLHRLWDVIRPHRLWIALSLGLLLVNSACRLALPFIVKTAIDDHLLADSMQGYWLLVGSFLGVALLEVVCRRYQMISLERAGQNALFDLRLRVFRHLQRLPASFYDRTPIGRLVGRVTTDIESLQEMFSSGLVTILGDFVFLIAAVCILLSLSAPLTLATMVMVPLLVGITLFVRGRVRAAYMKMRSRISQMNGVLHEQVSGMPIVQMFGQEERSAQTFGATNIGVREAQLRTVRWESTLSALTEMLGSFTTALILWFGGSLALESLGAAPLGTDPVTAGLTLGTLFAFVDYMQKFFIPLNDLSLKFTVLQNAVVASERIFGLLDEQPERPDPAPAARATGDGAIEFRGVTFAYDPGQPVLRDLSFAVRPGERVAVVGATGAGKTTILSLLTRLYETTEGEILLDGVDTAHMAREDLRRQVGVVAQDVFLFRGTILDNIRLGHPDITDQQAISAADQLHLDEIVSRFPGGYREPIAERGKNLSAGEKQLIAFARMLVVAPKVLALDEATSNVDSRTEQLLQEAVHRLMIGRTSLVIAHRLSTIRDADRILVMHRGELVEQGTHQELIDARGAYWRLYQLQFEGRET